MTIFVYLIFEYTDLVSFYTFISFIDIQKGYMITVTRYKLLSGF
jgi:hypothetical protein